MAKYFLGSVGEAEAYQVETNSFTGESTTTLVFTSKTITDSAVNISVNKEQIVDSYNGASAGVFYHSPNVNITLSDILWNPKFLEASLGSKFNQMCDDGNIEYYTLEATANANGYVVLSPIMNGVKIKYPAPIGLPSIGEGDVYVIIGKMEGDTEWGEYAYGSVDGAYCIGYDFDHLIQRPGNLSGFLRPGATYCFKYPVKSNRSKAINITSRIIPEELMLVITTPIFVAEGNSLNPMDGAYAGEDGYISTGKMVGKIIYEVPRWVLDGDLSFNFTASGTTSMQITGTVLESIDNEEESVFMRLREVVKPRAWYEGLVELFSSDSIIQPNESPTIYALYSDGQYREITSTPDNITLVFKPNSGASYTNAPNSTYVYDGVTYNVTGQFSSINGTVNVYPAVLWIDEHNNEIFVVLDDIYCSIDTGG